MVTKRTIHIRATRRERVRVVVVIAAAATRVRETSSSSFVCLFVFFQKKVRSIKSARFVFCIFLFFPARAFFGERAREEFTRRGKEVPFAR